MTFEQLKNGIRDNMRNAEEGYFNCIPWHGFERLKPFLPGIISKEYYLITGSSGSAKSKLARTMFIHDPYNYIKSHPELGIELDIMYWSLEEDVEKIYSTELSRLLKVKFDVSIGYRKLMSIGEKLPSDILGKIDQCEEDFNDWKKHIHVFGPENSNPTGIFKEVRNKAYEIGRFYDRDGNPFTDEMMEEVKNGIGETYKKVAYYRKNNPRHYVIILVDHVSLVKCEKGMDLRSTIEKLSSEYMLTFKNLYGFTPVIVQQQNSLKEKMQFTSSGNSIEEKLEPSLDSLGECTTTQRDITVAFGIFGPNRYGIQNHNGYNITVLKDYYRSLSLLKQRDAKANVKLPLFFSGASDFFGELPRHDEKKKLEMIYEKCKNLKE